METVHLATGAPVIACIVLFTIVNIFVNNWTVKQVVNILCEQ